MGEGQVSKLSVPSSMLDVTEVVRCKRSTALSWGDYNQYTACLYYTRINKRSIKATITCLHQD